MTKSCIVCNRNVCPFNFSKCTIHDTTENKFCLVIKIVSDGWGSYFTLVGKKSNEFV